MLRISSTYLASGNFLCTFCKRWRREGRQFQVMAFTRGLERRYITSCQNTIRWTMTRLPYMSDVRRASNCTSRIDQKCLKRRAGGEATTARKRDGRNKAITLLNCNVSQNNSDRGDRKQIHSGKIQSPPGLIDRRNPSEREIAKAVKVCPEESLVKRNQRPIRQSEAHKLKKLEKFGKTVKMKPSNRIFGTGNLVDRTKSKPRARTNVGTNGAIWDRATADKADKAFVEFQEMLRVPGSAKADRLLIDQGLPKKSTPRLIKKKAVKVFKVSDPHVQRRLQKNKINVRIYDQTRLLREDEPQCEFAEVQCGRKKLYLAFLEDGAPENVADKLPIKNVAPRSKSFPEKLMNMTPATLSKITPEKIVKMIRDSKAGGGKLVKMIHDQTPKGGREKSRGGDRDRSLQVRIPRKNADLKLVINLKKPLENMSGPTIHLKRKTPNGTVAKTMRFQIKKMEKYLLLTNNGKISVRYLTGGLTNIKQRLLEKLEIPKMLKCPVAVSGQGKIVLFEKVDDSRSAGTTEDVGTSSETPKESLVKKFKLLNLKKEEKSEKNGETDRKYLSRILKRKPRKVANEKVDEGKLIEARLNNNVSETFSKFDNLLQGMDKPKENLEKQTKTEMESDQGKKKIPAEAAPSKEKVLLPKHVPRLNNKEDVIQEDDIIPKPKPKVTVPAWKEIEKINKEKQAQLSKVLPSQLVDPYFLQLQQQRLKQKDMQWQVANEAGAMTAPEQWDPTFEGSTLPAEEQVQQWSQSAQENLTVEETMPSQETQGNTHHEVGPGFPNQLDQPQTDQHLQGTPRGWTAPAAEAQSTGQTSQTSVDPPEPFKTDSPPQPPANDFYYPEVRNPRSRRPNLPPPVIDERTTHFVSLLPEPEHGTVPIDVQVPSVVTGREVHMYDAQPEEAIKRPLVEDAKPEAAEIILREDLPDYLPEDIVNKWGDKNWDVRNSWETRADKVPNLRKLVRANSGNADYVHSFIIESDTLGECYRALRQTPDFTPKTDAEYNFKYDQEPEMRMFENVVAQNFTRVDDPDFIQVRRLRNDKAKVETTVTSVTVIHPEVKVAPEVSTHPESPVHFPGGLSAGVQAVTDSIDAPHARDSYLYRESSANQVAERDLDADAKPVLNGLESWDVSRSEVTMSGSSQINEAREVIYPERDNPDPSPTHESQSLGFRSGEPEKKFHTVDNAPRQRPGTATGYGARSEVNPGEGKKENNTKTVEKQEKEEKQENLKILASESGKSTQLDELKPAGSRDKPKPKQEEEKIANKSGETLAVIADIPSDKNNKSGEAKTKKGAEKVKEEADQKVKEEIMQKLKEELSSKLKNEWKVKLFDELADRIKPVIELKLTSDKPKNQIYLEKAKSGKLEAQREQPQVKDQLKEELKELKEELKKIKMKEELKQELKSELKSEFTSRTTADARSLDYVPVRLDRKKVNEGREQVDVPGRSAPVQVTAGQTQAAVNGEDLEGDKTRDETSRSESSVSAVTGWLDGHYDHTSVHEAEEKQRQPPSRSDVQNHGHENPSTLEMSEVEQAAEKGAGNPPRHLPPREHPYLPRRDDTPQRDLPERRPQQPCTKPKKDHPYLPKWDPIPQRNPPGEPSHPQPQPPSHPYYPHTQPPQHPYQPEPHTPDQPYQPYQPQPQHPNQPSHPYPPIPSPSYEPHTLPPSQPPQPQTPNHPFYPPHRQARGASQYESEVHQPFWNQGIPTPAEEISPVQDGHGQRNYKEEAQPQEPWQQLSNPPQTGEARKQPLRWWDEEALSQSRQKYFKITLPETKMEDGKKTEDVKAKKKEDQDPAKKKEDVRAKQKENQDPGKKKEDEKIINQQSRAKFFKGLMPEKQNPEEKPDEKIQREENQGKKYFRSLLPDQKTPGKFMKFKGDHKKPKGAKKEEADKGKPNKTPAEIKLKELPPTKPEIKKSSDNKPPEILVKSIEAIVEQSRKSEMETAKQVEATEQKKLIKQEQEAAEEKEKEAKKQLEAAEQKELLRLQQEAAAKRDLEMRRLQEEADRKYKEALEAKRREELARRVPGIAGYGVVMAEPQAAPVVGIPPDKKPDESKDDRFSDEKKIKLPGPESKTEKKSNPEEERAARKEDTPAKSPVTSAERMKSFLSPLKFGTASSPAEKQASEDNEKKKPSPGEAQQKKADDKKEKLSPLLEWERKILGGSDKSQVDEGKKGNISASPDAGTAAHNKQKAPEESSKLADLGKRKSNLSEWEKEIDEQMSSFFGGVPSPAKEEKTAKESELVPRKEESTPSDGKPKMHREDDNEVFQARVEQYLNIYDAPKKGGGDSDSGTPVTPTMILPDIEQYDRSDANDTFSAGLKANDFNLYLSQEEAEEVLRYNRNACQTDSEVSFASLDQTSASPSFGEMNLLTEPASAKSEVTLTPEQESSVHVVKVVFEDKKSGAGIGEENKRRGPEEANEKELKSFVDLLRSMLPSEYRDTAKTFTEQEVISKTKTDGEKQASSELELCMQLLKMAIANTKSEIFREKRDEKPSADAGNNGVNLQPFLELLKRTITNAERPGSRVAHDEKQDRARDMEAGEGKNCSGSYMDIFRKVVDPPASEPVEKRILQTGAGDVRGGLETDFRWFLQILKEAIAKVDNQAQESKRDLTSKKEQKERFTGDPGLVQTSKKHESVDRVESTKNKDCSDQVESSPARKEPKDGKSKVADVEHSRKACKEKPPPVVERLEDDSEANKKERGMKTKEVGEEGLETSKKTIQVDKIIVNIKADPEERETSEKRRKTSRKTLRKLEEVPGEEVAEKQERSARKKKYRRKKFEEETMPKKKHEFLEEKRRRKLASASEDDPKKLAKTVPEKEPELQPGSQLMSEIKEETTPVDYGSSTGDHANRTTTLEVTEISPRPKRESFMGDKVVKEFTVREEPFDIEPVSGNSKAAFAKRDVQSVEANIRAARIDKCYMREGKSGKLPRTILPDSPNVDVGCRSPAEEREDPVDGAPMKTGKKLPKIVTGKEQCKAVEIQKAVREETSEEEPVKFADGRRDSKAYAKSSKKNVSGLTQKRDLQTLATAMLRSADGGRVEGEPPEGESVLGDALRHRIASAPYRKTELSCSEREMSAIRDKTELKTVRVTEDDGWHPGGAAAKKANEVPCAVAVDPESPPAPPPALAGAVLSPAGRKTKTTSFWWRKIEPAKK